MRIVIFGAGGAARAIAVEIKKSDIAFIPIATAGGPVIAATEGDERSLCQRLGARLVQGGSHDVNLGQQAVVPDKVGKAGGCNDDQHRQNYQRDHHLDQRKTSHPGDCHTHTIPASHINT